MHADPAAPPMLACGRFRLALDRPHVMGIVNVTPDSFSDGGRHGTRDAAVAHARRLVEQGAALLDVGGESTRPGATPVPLAEELDRVMPVIEALMPLGVPLSIDTRRPEVMRAALAAGVDLVNDIEALRAPGSIDAVASSGCAICLMHMQGSPGTMQAAPAYGDVLAEVGQFLEARVMAVESAGIARDRLVVDPGIGFGKTLDHNLALLAGLDRLVPGMPVLVGLSRKGMIGALTGRPVEQRDAGSVGGALAAIARGATFVRVHDVAATVDAIRVWQAIHSFAREAS